MGIAGAVFSNMKILNEREIIKPMYEVGDLLLKIREDDYWFDHLIILNIELSLNEYVYQLFTSEGEVERRTVEWVQLNYKKSEDKKVDLSSETEPNKTA